MKKLLSWILVLALCLSLFPCVALAEDAEDPVGEIAPVEDPLPPAEDEDPGEPVVADAPGGPSGTLDVPSDDPAALPTDPAADEIQDATASGTCGDNLTWTLENGVLTISGTGAMKDWDNESSVPWYGLRQTVLEIELPDGLTSIGEQAFRGCIYLESVTIPEGVTSIGRSSFYGCNRLTNVAIPDSVTSIGNYAFSGCSSLTSVTIPSSVTSIGGYAFSGCSSLTSVTIPDGVSSIESHAFEYCRKMTSVTIPESVTSIGYAAFLYCSSLISVTIPDSVTSIGYYAFEGCSSLTSVTIPSSVTQISAGAFCFCSSLSAIHVAPESNTFKSVDGILYNADLTGLVQFPAGKSGEFSIPQTVTAIEACAFCGCVNLTGVTIPSSVNSIGYRAFEDCDGLTSVTIPDGITIIENGTFSSCNNLESVILPNMITSIYKEAFEFCPKLTDLVLPSNLKSIGSYAFYYTGLTRITIPAGVTSIGDSAFSSCSNLKIIIFLGDAPSIKDSFPYGLTAALYPIQNITWTSSKRQNYGANSLTWVGYKGEAKASFVHYDSTGGSTVADQVKGNGVNIYLSSTRPTRSSQTMAYTVILDPNGGDGEAISRNGSYTISYSFVNWNTAQDGSGTAYSPGATYSQDEDLTLYAQWTENVGTDSVILPQIDREGHRLLGWARDPAATKPEFAPNSYYYGNKDITLYAVWAPYTFPVVYIVGKGAQGPESTVKTWGVDLTLSDMVPTAEGYDFMGWSLYNQSNIPDYQPGDVYIGNGNGYDGSQISFYAIWQLKIYLVTYKANGGEDAPAAQLKTHGRSLTLSEEAPYRDGYRFLGWSTNKWSTEPEYQPGDSFTANKDTTLYALWEKKYPEVPTGSVLALTDAQSAAGYDFTVDLTLDENPGVMMISFKLDYDKDALEFLGGEDGALTGWYFSDTGAVWDASSDRTETGCLAKLNFHVKDGADTGRTEIYITDLFTGNFNEESLIVDPVSSTVNIVQRVGGDVNSDGSVNGFDLLRLRKHLAGLDVEYSLVNSDVNGDGVVDLLDLVRLRKHLAGVNVDLG